MSLGSKLKELRVRKNESLQDVATAIGISKTYIWQLERDEEINPSLEVLKKIADHFSISVTSLVGEAPGLDEDDQLIRMFRNLGELTQRDREIIDEMIKAMKKRHERKVDED